MMASSDAPLIVHVIHRFDVGGMENGLVNLINHLHPDRYRHAVVSLTKSTDFRSRVHRDDVQFFSLHKKPGQDFSVYIRLYRLLRRLRPAIVHTRNLSTVESVIPAVLARVPCRVHGEHGRDVHDVDGTKRKYQLLRRWLSPLVHRFIALSLDLENYLVDRVGIPAEKVSRIINGVDLEKFHPGESKRATSLPSGFDEDCVIIGTVSRMQEIKDPLTLAKAFILLIAEGRAPQARLVMVGDGPLLSSVSAELERAGLERLCWLARERDDVSSLLRSFDIFALSSRVEGISNTILEAMATGLPVVATRVGGNHELIDEGVNGSLVPSRTPEAMARALARYLEDPQLMKAHGRAARERAETNFGIRTMLNRYSAIYEALLEERGLSMPDEVTDRTTTPCVE